MKTMLRFSLALVALLLCTANTCKGQEVSTQALARAISSSMDYLCAQVNTNGMFTYRVNTNPDVRLARKYNMLRHAGTLYAMCMAQEVSGRPDTLSAIHTAGVYLRDECVGPLQAQAGMSAVWSDPDVCGRDGPRLAKLGGAGLGLVALMSIESHTPGFTSSATLRELARFILFMQREDGSFHAKYIPSQGGLQDDWVSLYYPGEAALGLVMLYECDPDPVWRNGAVNALTYLAHHRSGDTTVPTDHWALIATERLLALKNIPDAALNRPLLLAHAEQIVRQILSEQIINGRYPKAELGFTWDGRTCPTSTRLEGLLAARQFLSDPALLADINNAIDSAMGRLLTAQITSGPFAGGMPRGVIVLPETAPRAEYSNRRVTEIRIDYVQHAMSAFIRYLHD